MTNYYTNFRTIFSIFLISGLIFSCSEAAKNPKAELEKTVVKKQKASQKAAIKPVPAIPKGKPNGKIKLNHDVCSLVFGGYKINQTGHKGSFLIKESNLVTVNDTLVGGKIVADIHSLQMIDESKEKAKKLKDHLLSKDFFSAKVHPEATFEIVKLTMFHEKDRRRERYNELGLVTHMIKGELTMRGKSNIINIPAIIDTKNGQFRLKTIFSIDRLEWGMHYNSDVSLGDKMIQNMVDLYIELYGTLE